MNSEHVAIDPATALHLRAATDEDGNDAERVAARIQVAAAADVVEAMRALGARDVVAVGGSVATLATVLAAAQRRRMDAVHAAVALDIVAPRAGAVWRPMCCLCIDSMEVALCADLEAYRINRDTGHDTGCCSFCGAGGRDTLVAAVTETIFAAPPAAFLASRCGYADGGGRLAYLNQGDRP